nr:ABC transporter ATP-binding protein [Nigerium massiliense]
MSEPALTLSSVGLALGGAPVLNGLSFEARPGRITALLGPNGAGKTTTIRCCTGLLTPDTGTIRVLDGAPGSPDVQARLGLMPQSTGAWSGVRPRELLAYLGSLYLHPQPTEQLIDLLGIGPFAQTPYRRLSGGQKQLVNLAGALVGRPELVFLDEPTAGMDPHVRHHTWDVIRALRDAGVAVLLTTHAMDEAQQLADHVWIMDAGAIALDGTVAELTREGSLESVFLAHTRGGQA